MYTPPRPDIQSPIESQNGDYFPGQETIDSPDPDPAVAYLHVEPLGLLDQGGGHGQEDDVRVKVRRAVVGVEALDPRLVHVADDGGHHVKTREAGGGDQ